MSTMSILRAASCLHAGVRMTIPPYVIVGNAREELDDDVSVGRVEGLPG